MLDQISRWLADHSLAVQAFSTVAGPLLTAVLVATTIFYAYTTEKILEESRKSREAAEKQAQAANETLRFVRQRYEEDLTYHLQELRAGIADGLDLARTWLRHVPGAIADPAELTENRLLDVAPTLGRYRQSVRGWSLMDTQHSEMPKPNLKSSVKRSTALSPSTGKLATHNRFWMHPTTSC